MNTSYWSYWSGTTLEQLDLTWYNYFRKSQSGVIAVRSTKAENLGGNKMYSLNGIRCDTMQRGINIVNGKKLIR